MIAVGAAVAAVAALSLGGFAPPATAAGDTWYVDQVAGADVPTCGAEAGPGACATITALIGVAADDDIISIATGNYVETLTFTDSVTLQGNGEVLLTGLSPDEPVIFVDAPAGPVTISDITMHPAPGAASAFGAVVQVAQDRSAELNRVSVIGPGGVAAGVGVMGSGGSSVVISDSSFTGLGYGVATGIDETGAASPGASLTMSSSVLTGNTAGVTAFSSDVTIAGGSISESFGAGIIAYGGDLEVAGTSISGNAVPEAGTFRGGVVLYSGGTFTGTDVVISGNDRAGIMLVDGGDVTLTSSTVTDNTGAGDGVGIFARPGDTGGEPVTPTVSLTGTTVSGHDIGLALDSAQTDIATSEISDNVTGVRTQSSTERGSLEIIDSVLTRNGPGTPESTPAGLLIEGPTDVVATDTDITDNVLGMLVNRDSQVTMSGGTVSDNSWVGILAAEEPRSLTETTIDLSGTSITGNGLEAPLAGVFGFGGIAARFEATITGDDLTIAGNAAGIVMQGGALSLTDSSIRDNVVASLDDLVAGPITGHGILAGPAGTEWHADVELVRTEIAGNARTGVMVSPDTTASIATSTIAGNGGAGISVETLMGIPDEYPASSLLVAGSTVAENGGGALQLSEILELTVAGSILQAPDGVPACSGELAGLVDAGVNVFSDESCASGPTSVVAEPLLEPLADNGGPTRTALPGPTSLAVNLVPVGTTVPWGESTIDLCPGDVDQRGEGYPRLVHDACDAGAVERSRGLITVTASEATWYEGAFEPEITPSYAGFLDGDTVTDLDTLPTCGYDSGTATTFCSGGADDFYDFTYLDGTLTVLDPLVILTDALPTGTVGQEYSVTLEATGGDGGPYTWGIHEGTLPAGLQLDTATGEISGTPETAGAVTFTVFVGDPILKEFTITVEEAPVEPTEPPTTGEPTDPPTEQPTTEEPTEQPTTVEPSASSPSAGADDSTQGLPDTGSDGLTTLAIGAAIALLGAAVFLVVRRHRDQRAS